MIRWTVHSKVYRKSSHLRVQLSIHITSELKIPSKFHEPLGVGNLEKISCITISVNP